MKRDNKRIGLYVKKGRLPGDEELQGNIPSYHIIGVKMTWEYATDKLKKVLNWFKKDEKTE